MNTSDINKFKIHLSLIQVICKQNNDLSNEHINRKRFKLLCCDSGFYLHRQTYNNRPIYKFRNQGKPQC